VIGSVGRLVAEKGFPELFEAARALPDQCVVIVAGPSDPAKRDALTSDADTTTGRGRVRLLGFREDVERLYAAFDVFVLASHREGYPRAAMEAAAAGLPLVLTDVRGCREVVDDGVNGLLVPPRDAGALAAAITRVVGNAEGRQRMGARSRAKAEAEFDERRVVDIVFATYDGQARPSPMRRGSLWARMVKRILDLTGAGVGLVVLSPLLAAVALLVRLRLGRPVLFVQDRPGLDGRSFRIYKFRTMSDASDPSGRRLPDAERLTPLGRWLRSWSLDELPELWNVLRGDMSLVGPRPLLPQYLDRYRPDQSRRHAVKPGITGWAQVNGRNVLDWDERLALDTWYADHWTLRLDLQILARTLPGVFSRSGITHPDHETMPELPARSDRPGPSREVNAG
jgi:lipopolysaccharide/colanic/teichoic acid biosynthesis glycosyltransferase